MNVKTRKRVKRIFIAVSIVLIVAWIPYRLTMPGLLFLLRFLNQEDERVAFQDIETKNMLIHQNGRSIRFHLYQPKSGYDRVYLVVHGVHHGGYDEERMVGFSKQLARLGNLVATPEIVDLRNYEISTQAVEDIFLSAKWLIFHSTLVEADESIGIMGFSFSGGLSVGVAARPEIADRISIVFSFGGHADLDRVMRYLCTGQLPGGTTLPPHVYGQAVIARLFAEELVPKEEVAALRAVLFDYLKNEFNKVKSTLSSLGPTSRHIVSLCLESKSTELGKILETKVKARRFDDALSPIRGAVPKAAVFLLHGSADNVIPPSETTALARFASPMTTTHALITSLINHVELEKGESTTFKDYYDIIRFWTELLRC